MSTAGKNTFGNIVYYGPAVVYALVIFFMSSLPDIKLPDIGIDFGDKFIHMIEFGLFGIFLYRAFRYNPQVSRPYLLTVCTGLLYAASDEFHQLFVPGRECDIIDFAADAVGLIIFSAMSVWLNAKKQANNSS